jgi:hypothetical protein
VCLMVSIKAIIYPSCLETPKKPHWIKTRSGNHQ